MNCPNCGSDNVIKGYGDAGELAGAVVCALMIITTPIVGIFFLPTLKYFAGAGSMVGEKLQANRRSCGKCTCVWYE